MKLLVVVNSYSQILISAVSSTKRICEKKNDRVEMKIKILTQ